MGQKAILLLFFLTVTFTCFAQPGPPGDPDVPITGVEWLIVAGGLLGIRKFFNSRKTNS